MHERDTSLMQTHSLQLTSVSLWWLLSVMYLCATAMAVLDAAASPCSTVADMDSLLRCAVLG